MIKKIIRFTASWCMPCKHFAPIFDEVSKLEKYSDIEFKVIDVDDEESDIEKYKIKSIPTVVLEDENGNILKKIIGVVQSKDLINLIDDSLNVEQ